MAKPIRGRVLPALVGLGVVGLLGAVTGTALASSGSGGGTDRMASAPVGGEVPGLTGAAAQRAEAAAADRFRQVTADRISRMQAAAGGTVTPFTDLHTAWGIFFNDRASSGLQATHSVQNITTHGD